MTRVTVISYCKRHKIAYFATAATRLYSIRRTLKVLYRFIRDMFCDISKGHCINKGFIRFFASHLRKSKLWTLLVFPPLLPPLRRNTLALLPLPRVVIGALLLRFLIFPGMLPMQRCLV